MDNRWSSCSGPQNCYSSWNYLRCALWESSIKSNNSDNKQVSGDLFDLRKAQYAAVETGSDNSGIKKKQNTMLMPREAGRRFKQCNNPRAVFLLILPCLAVILQVASTRAGASGQEKERRCASGFGKCLHICTQLSITFSYRESAQRIEGQTKACTPASKYTLKMVVEIKGT